MRYDPTIYYQADPIKKLNRKSLSKLSPETQIARARFAKRFIRPESTIADICCGSGWLSQCPEYKKYIGVDHPAMIPIIKKNGEYKSEKTFFVPFDFEDTSKDLDIGEHVDAIFSFETIEHLSDGEKFLNNLNKNLKQKGLLILSTPLKIYKNSLRYQDHIKEYTLEEMYNLLNKTGFKLQSSYIMGVPFGLLARMFKKLGIKTHRYNYEEERGKLSKTLDYLPSLRRLYCKILPYNVEGMDIGKSGEYLILISSKL